MHPQVTAFWAHTFSGASVQHILKYCDIYQCNHHQIHTLSVDNFLKSFLPIKLARHVAGSPASIGES